MKKAVTFLCRALFSTAVIGGLTFGAVQARAGSIAADCPNPPYDGTCASQQDCQRLCESIYGPEIIGDCTPWGCCACFF